MKGFSLGMNPSTPRSVALISILFFAAGLCACSTSSGPGDDQSIAPDGQDQGISFIDISVDQSVDLTTDSLPPFDAEPNPLCGNGSLDPNEDCETPFDDCCDSVTCRYKTADRVCRPAAGSCDIAEICDGLSATCPDDTLIGAGAECRPVAGDCDIAEICDGLSATCPDDTLIDEGTECRSAAGDCDIAESCDGLSPGCPADLLEVSGTECRSAAGACDIAEICDGVSASCPDDLIEVSGTECRPAANECDIAETCNGSSANCPADAFQINGTPCQNGILCLNGECWGA
jgi:hypothetical protein